MWTGIIYFPIDNNDKCEIKEGKGIIKEFKDGIFIYLKVNI